MGRMKWVILVVSFALSAIASSGCDDEGRTYSDEDDDDVGEDAGADEDTGSVDTGEPGRTGVYGELWGSSHFDVSWYTVAGSPEQYSAQTNTDGGHYYELDLVPGIYNANAEAYSSWEIWEGGVRNVVVSEGVWLKVDIPIGYTVIE